ncbi:MAG: ASCH domain-containing protein [Chloroflexi bacterium]|nr:ASCH domain-containing protein [Chloroflexota bacterium]
MKALSIRQPWAWAIFHAGKNFENRTWFHSYRGRIVIHTGKAVDKSAVQKLRAKGHQVPMNLPVGCLVGEVDIVGGVDRFGKKPVGNPWYEGEYGFFLANPKAYDDPVPYKGKLGFFEVEPCEKPEAKE